MPKRSATIWVNAVSKPLPHRHRSGAQDQRAILRKPQRGQVLRRAQERPAGDLDAVAQADAAQLAARLGVRASCREVVEFRQRRRGLHVAFELAAIVGEGQRGLVRHRFGRDQVAPAQLVRLDAQLARRDVDQPLDRIGCLRPPGAAIRRGRHRVRHDAAGFRVDRRDVIHAGGAADIADRPAGAAGHIRTQVHVPAQPQRGEFAVRRPGRAPR